MHGLATEPLEEICRFENEFVTPAMKPGLGVRISDELLARFPCQAGHEQDYRNLMSGRSALLVNPGHGSTVGRPQETEIHVRY